MTHVQPRLAGLLIVTRTTIVAAAFFSLLGAGTPAAAQCPDPGSPITIADPGTRHSSEGGIVSVPIVVLSAPAGAFPLAYAASGLPAGLSIDPGTGVMSGTLAVGIAGTYTVTVTVTGSDSSANCRRFEWKVSEWLVGEIFAGLADFSGNYNWWSRLGDLWKGQLAANPGYVSAGCASDWRTGDLFTTDFGYAPSTGARRFSGVPAHDVIAFFDSVFNPATGEYRDTVPESVALASNGSVFVGHADGYFAPQLDPLSGDPVDPCAAAHDCVPSDANGFPLVRGFFFDPASSAWEFDESYVELGPSPGVPGALVLDETGNTVRYSAVAVGHYFVDGNGQPLLDADGSYLYAGKRDGAGRPYWHVELNPPYRDSIPINLLPAGTQLKPFYERSPGQPVPGPLGALIPARLQDGRNLHVYRPDGAGGYHRTAYDTLYNAKGTDWIDLSSDQRTIFYTSEYGVVHRYDAETGTQLPPFAVVGESAMYALRLLPPGDGSGGLLAAAARHVVRLNGSGITVQTYQGRKPCPDGTCPDMGHFALTIDPDGRSFWTGSLNTGDMYRLDIASGAMVAGPISNAAPLGGMCVKLEYTAAQEVCNDFPILDDDGDGLVNENCAPLEICSPLVSPGDDDGDGLIDVNDPDCGAGNVPPEVCGDGLDNNDDGRIDEGTCDRRSAEQQAVAGVFLVPSYSEAPDRTFAVDPLSPLPPGLQLNAQTGEITGEPPCSAVTRVQGSRTWPVHIVMTDAGGPSDLFVDWTVTDVACAPLAAADSYATSEEVPLAVGAAAGLLANDVGFGDTLIVVSCTQPAHGIVTVNPDGSFTYTPNADFWGVDTFTYIVEGDYGLTSSAAVTIAVDAVNDAPAAVDDGYTASEDTPLTVVVPGVLGNDTDVDGDALSAVVLTGPTHGTLTLNADGSFTYTPDPNWNGQDSFRYQASDGTLGSNAATVNLLVTPANDAPVAGNDAFTVIEEQALSGSVAGNDSDVDTTALTWVLVGGPTHGTLVFDADGTFVYTPNAGYVGPDSFTYRVSDGALDSNVATVSLTVAPGNQPPDCDSATANPATIWPANHQFIQIGINGVTDPDGGVAISVTSIYQDEPTHTDGDGSHTPDGRGVGASKASVRAERSGTAKTPGNGRVYTINFSATDSSGASCTGAVTVCVPHDQGRRSSCVNDGAQYDSTVTAPPLPSR